MSEYFGNLRYNVYQSICIFWMHYCMIKSYWSNFKCITAIISTASSEFGTYCLCEQRRLRRACASVQSHQNLRCSLIQAASQEEPSDRKPDPWPLWMAGHAQLKFVMTECSKTQVRLTRHILSVPIFTTFTVLPYEIFPEKDGKRNGRSHGSGIQWQQSHSNHGTYC